MKIHFLGVGEACDSSCGNTSLLVEAADKQRILLDCGFSVPHRLFRHIDDPEQLDAVYISHFHGDHFFGMPLLLLRLWEMDRSRELLLIGQEGCREKVLGALDLAYPGFYEKLGYPLRFMTILPDSPLAILGLDLLATQTIHGQCNLALQIDDGSHKIYYSGDGRPGKNTADLIHNCDLIVHEAFTMENSLPSHGSVATCLQLFEKSDARKMALVHLERTFRQQLLQGPQPYFQSKNVILPFDDATLSL